MGTLRPFTLSLKPWTKSIPAQIIIISPIMLHKHWRQGLGLLGTFFTYSRLPQRPATAGSVRAVKRMRLTAPQAVSTTIQSTEEAVLQLAAIPRRVKSVARANERDIGLATAIRKRSSSHCLGARKRAISPKDMDPITITTSAAVSFAECHDILKEEDSFAYASCRRLSAQHCKWCKRAMNIIRNTRLSTCS